MSSYQSDLTTELMARSKFAAIAQYFLFSLAVSYTYFNSYWNLGCQISLGLFLVVNTLRYVFSSTKKMDLKLVRIWLEILAGATSLVWALLFLASTSVTNITPMGLGVMIFLIAGVTSSAVFSLSLSRSAVLVFVTPLILCMMTPFVIHYQSWRSDLIPILIMAMFFIFVMGQQKKIFEAWYLNFQKKEELNTIFEGFPGGMCLIENNQIIRSNDSMRASISDEFVLNFFSDFKNEDIQTKTKEIELTDLNSSQKKIYLITAHRIRKFHNKSLIFLVDIDEQKRTQNLLAKQQMALADSMKMAALGEMSNGMAHEINNPLAIISSKSQLIYDQLSQGKPLDPRFITTSMKKISETSFRIAGIIKSLQRFSKDPSNDPFEFNKVSQIIQDAIALSQARMNKAKIKLSVQLQNDILVYSQAGQLTQTVLNILNNSIDAVQNLDENKRWIEIQAIKNDVDHKIQLLVRDGGPGIHENLRGKVMNPFFTTKQIGQGMGLGLSVAKGIIESHKGNIYFNFESPSTELIIELPHQSSKNQKAI